MIRERHLVTLRGSGLISIISFPNIVFTLEITLDGDYFIFKCRLHTKITLDGVTPGVLSE